METIEIERQPVEFSRARRLKAATHDAHERLDKTIMAHEPFSSRERYADFLRVQCLFHRDIDALYADSTLDVLLPDLAGRRRLGLIEQDLADLGVAPPPADREPVFARSASLDLPVALGWLYVAEGSNLGAAFLLKAAAKLDLSEAFGARHLAAAPEGRGLHWRTFTAALDAAALTPAQDARAVASAEDAFDRVYGLVQDVFSS